MLGKKAWPERNVRTMLDEHIDMVGAVLYKALDTIEHYANDWLADDTWVSGRPYGFCS